MTRIFAALAAAVLICGHSTAGAAELEKLWELDGLKWPESALPDASGQVIYVSNVDGAIVAKDGEGSISKVSIDGAMVEAEWATGLNAPKGLAIAGDRIYVADVDELVAIGLSDGKVVKRYPAKDAKFLNDVVAHPDGRVFVSDTMTNTIWMLEKDRFEPFVSDPRLHGPNGLVVEGDRLIVAPIGKLPKDGDPGEPAHLMQVSLADRSIADLGSGAPVGFLDGLAPLGDGSYLASDFGRGPIYRIAPDGAFKTLADLPPTTADLSYVAARRMALVPHSKSGKLIAYRVPEPD